jgi:hypothetical protein
MILKSISVPLHAVNAVGAKVEKEALHAKMVSHLVTLCSRTATCRV